LEIDMQTRQLRRAATAVCFLGAVSAACWPAAAADRYVATTGADTNPGTQAAPYRTIAKAASVVLPGETVHVAAGTYRQVLSLNRSGTATARIRYVSDTRWGAKILPPSRSKGETVVTVGGDHVDIEGFDISASGFSTFRTGLLNTGEHVAMRRNRVHHIPASSVSNLGGSGINSLPEGPLGWYYGVDVEILGNHVHDIGPVGSSGLVHGIYVSHPQARVFNNIVCRVPGGGIHLWHNPSDIVIAHNLVVAAGTGIIVGAGDSPGTGVARDITVASNIVRGGGAAILETGVTGTGNRYLNNLLYGNSRDTISLKTGVQSGTIVADPLQADFRADCAGDYHLTSASPAVDAGSATDAPSVDHDGNARPQGDEVDIGPYEWVP
jgi:hypothetical protein